MTTRSSSRGGISRASISELAKSMPPQQPTYEQFRASRTEKINQAVEDTKATKEAELKDLQAQLQDYILRINTAQSTLAQEERDFMNEKESLLTELKQIKIDAEAKSAESRMNHLSNIEQLQEQHAAAIAQYAASLQNMKIPQDNIDDKTEIENVRSQLQETKNQIRGSKTSAIEPEDDKIPTSESAYISRISMLESKKRELMKVLKEEEQTNKARVTEMTMLLDDQETQYQKEIQQFQAEMKKKEDKYQEELARLFAELDRTQAKRAEVVGKQKAKIDQIQNQINTTEAEFKQKLSKANVVAEKLKAALINANMRKTQQLELEKQRSEEQQNLLRESFAIQQNIAKLKSELEKARKDSAFLRRELTSKIGARRAASLFA
ncbi:hypothetical protein TVAG_092780 [Trichomonas vaginalis G3]|uniref:Uncharacterized protein n=1 Tax=Trichomonas vaginalis (strain ATCC PRA-98 / G3) TaxID=412133 RepID=A2FTT5_TRIV3|nr:hypothetical protein TVAGG3_0060700 [Trichomonas vaginalis G3]EAX91692.1 hypothetical protein TVAG_092780 [Trichomonas vaginalis G3]KAI5541984.1 hypothetical protein TVAGG3_0060700 [Trichomonas vaginalis G3]|eukprot:XP_001304622.1 hypothetical protein [Trichomonas vaginalis G3]